MVRIGLLGYGTVGQAFAALVAHQTRVPAEIAVALVRNADRRREGPSITLTHDPSAVVDRPDLDLVVDVMGGKDPARQLIVRALSHRKPVISANKEVMAEHGPELLELARRYDVSLSYEAAVGGGIPLLEPLVSHFAAAPVTQVVGILNGTTNYILSRMESGDAANRALAQAQALGYAEADPTADLDGMDVLRKLSLVIGALFAPVKNVNQIPRLGLDDYLPMAIRRVRAWGYRIKLLGRAERGGGAQVWPTLVPEGHRLAAISGVHNLVGVEVFGQWFWMEGAGAGGQATALSLLADLYRGYRFGFRAGRLEYPTPLETRPLIGRWLAFGIDPDRPLSRFHSLPGSIIEPEYIVTPPVDQPQIARWLSDNSGLIAYPLFTDNQQGGP